MNTKLQQLEVKTTLRSDDDLTVEHASCGQLPTQSLNQLGKIAVERPLVAALDKNLVPIAEDKSTKPVPFGFEDPAIALGQFADALGKHGQNRRIYRKLHHPMVSPTCWAARK